MTIRRQILLLVARRAVALLFVLLLISFGVFSLLYLAPGSLEQVLLGGRPATPELVASLRATYHLNDSFLGQYFWWLDHAIRFQFGRSIRTNEPVSSVITGHFAITFFLGLYAFMITLLIGIPLGMLAALAKGTALDRTAVALTVVGVSVPAFATGIVLLYLFGIEFPWFPIFGAGSGLVDRLWHLTMPAIALALTVLALVVKFARAGMITALEQDFVTFARARGLSWRRVMLGYALRNALVPIVTASGLILGYLLTGAVLVETVFALPGLGSLLVDSVNYRDVPVVQGLAMLTATLIVLANLLTDIAYMLIDPRIRFGESAL